MYYCTHNIVILVKYDYIWMILNIDICNPSPLYSMSRYYYSSTYHLLHASTSTSPLPLWSWLTVRMCSGRLSIPTSIRPVNLQETLQTTPCSGGMDEWVKYVCVCLCVCTLCKTSSRPIYTPHHCVKPLVVCQTLQFIDSAKGKFTNLNTMKSPLNPQ